MQRDREIVVRIPKELEQDFRLFVVLHGGQIVEAKDVEDENFLDDEEKMYDFVRLTKEEFLESYSYLTEKEYNDTLRAYNKQK